MSPRKSCQADKVLEDTDVPEETSLEEIRKQCICIYFHQPIPDRFQWFDSRECSDSGRAITRIFPTCPGDQIRMSGPHTADIRNAESKGGLCKSSQHT